ncbi:MAG TPA: FAD-binding oxidoreductase [Verrucomicrobiae bacterium]|nr:FAD-binding oxidoreductase [Verrucomicrobiae bacterium]
MTKINFKSWHNIPRDKINWYPIVDEDACIGCGTCVIGCGSLVYKFDFNSKKAKVVDPLSCIVGCVTCANTCPTKAISFPPLDEIYSLLSESKVHHAIEDELLSKKENLEWIDILPHKDKIVSMIVDDISHIRKDLIIVKLKPKMKVVDDSFCHFMPGQYVELWIPETKWLSRAYSIGNSPHEDGSIELQIRRIDEGRYSEWVFEKMKVGDTISVRGPLGNFTICSETDTPIIFIAGGTGFAPIKSMIEQLFKINPDRKNILLLWGARDSNGFYELEVIHSWIKENTHFKCILATKKILDGFILPKEVEIVESSLVDVIQNRNYNLSEYDAYVAGPPAMMPYLLKSLMTKGIKRDRIRIDSFGG